MTETPDASGLPGLDYYRARLTNPALADHAAVVEVAPGEHEPAVPVGGDRSAGHLVCCDPQLAATAVRQLTALPGFPHARLGAPAPGENAWPVEWGTELPDPPTCGHRFCSDLHDLNTGFAYGYSYNAVAAHLARPTTREP